MSIDHLHEKVRKLKNPSVVDFSLKADCVPAHLIEQEGSFLGGYLRFCRELMAGLKGIVPAVRFSMGRFALLGPEGLNGLRTLLTEAKEHGFYVLLDGPEILSPWDADCIAESVFGGTRYPCDGLIISPYIGADAIKPFVPYCKNQQKDLFVVLRSPNKTAADLQDLMSGSRLVHQAAADLVNRHGESIEAKCAYSRICGVVSAGNANSIRNIRNNYRGMYLLVDGLDYPSGNHKNCSHAFDQFGFGAAVCAGPSVTAAWKEAESDGTDYVEQAKLAAERMKKNLLRYITVL